MIPKKIHYCWFGGHPKPVIVSECIKSWKAVAPAYEIIEWNESNCDIENACDFVKKAAEQKKWAFVSDYFRLKALYELGGIYLDTDVELIRSFDNLLNLDFFCCHESDEYLCTAVIGSSPNNEIIKNIFQKYDALEFDQTPNSKLFYNVLVGESKCAIDKSYHINENEIIFPFYYFSPKNFYSNKIYEHNDTYAIHHFDGTWKSGRQRFKDKILRALIKIFGKEKVDNLRKKGGGKKS